MSIALRRAALRLHSGEGRWRQLAQVMGLRVPRRATVSVLLATNRPDYLDHAVQQVARQDYPDVELIVGLHGEAFDSQVEARIREAYDGPCQILRIDAAETLGGVLNACVDVASGELVSKMDDDDWYGKEHVSDLVLALDYSDAELVAKGAEFVYLAELGITIRRFTVGAESSSRTIAGGTLLLPRHVLAGAGGWRRVRRSVDQLLIDDVLGAGGSVYRTHGHGYVLNRHGQGHTWNPSLDYFLDQAARQWRGLAVSAASVG
jgi:hypothetical protein